MLIRSKTDRTAIFTMAVLFLVIVWLGGCVTPRRMDELSAELKQVQQQNRKTHSELASLDSLVSEESENNRRLQANVSVTIDQLEQQVAALQESYNDLLQKIEAIYQATYGRRHLTDSPGAQPDTSGVVAREQLGTSGIDCSRTYDDAFILVRQGEYEKAIESFKAFLAECKGHELVENAHYWIGESYYSLERYDDAIEEFEFLLGNYRSSVNTSRALYKLGRSQQELGKKAEAKKAFQRLIEEHPGTLEAEQAKERLKDLK